MEYTKNRLRGDLDCGVVVFASHIAICEESAVGDCPCWRK